MRNFVTVKSARFSIVVEDEPGYFISLSYVQAYLVAWCWTQEPCQFESRIIDYTNSISIKSLIHSRMDNLPSNVAAPKRGKMRESVRETILHFLLGILGFICISLYCVLKQLDFHTGHSSPVILITRATYGEIGTASDPRDMSRSIDVTNEVQSKVIPPFSCSADILISASYYYGLLFMALWHSNSEHTYI